VERLLAAVDRLRGERNELRRQFEFLQAESKFTIQALENKINSEAAMTTVATVAEDPRIPQLQSEVQELLGRLAKTSSCLRVDSSSSAMESSRLALIASASLVMVGHLQTRIDHDTALKDHARVEISGGLHSRVQDIVVSHDESLRTAHGLQKSLVETQNQLESGLISLHDVQQQRNNLLLQVEHLQSQVATNDRIREQYHELQSNLEDTTARLSDVTKALEDVESERNSLRVEIVNLQGDMALAQEELKQAERRYSDLQNQQLSSMSSSQINRKLMEQIEELEARVARRTAQIGIHQHDIKRLETNLKLQEDRIGEMTSELEVALSEKESMVEDCAETREARDRALKRGDHLEDVVASLETQLQGLEERREIEVATMVKVWSSLLVESRASTTHLRAAAYQANITKADLAQRLQLVSAEHNSAMELLHKQALELSLAQNVATTHGEEARDAVVALAVIQTANAESQRTMRHDRDRICALLSATRDELNIRFEEINSLQDQLQRMREQGHAESTELQSTQSAEVKILREANTDLDRLRAELEDELVQTRKGLCDAIERQDQLRADGDAVRAQITQLQSDHVEQLESLRGKLQQVAVDLQEAREAHATAERACSELSLAKADLESRLDYISQHQDTDSELISELQNREADYSKRMLEVQNRLDKATEELQETVREREELDVALQQAKAELCKAKDTMEDRVSQLAEERDALQESLDQVKSRHATEVDQDQGRMRDLQTKANSLQTQLDKAIADQKRIRATFEAELRESVERHEASKAERDDVRARLATLEAELDDMQVRLQTVLEEKDTLEAKNTNLESEIQRTFSMQRYLESQLKDRSVKSGLCARFWCSYYHRYSAHEVAAVKIELGQVREKCAHAERDGKAAEIQLTFQSAQHEQSIASLRREIQLLRATSGPDERVQELEEKIGYMDELMRSKTQEIEENDDRFIEYVL
jgi:chromosome segregation ATPase